MVKINQVMVLSDIFVCLFKKRKQESRASLSSAHWSLVIGIDKFNLTGFTVLFSFVSRLLILIDLDKCYKLERV